MIFAVNSPDMVHFAMEEDPKARRAPALYERLVPLALGGIVLLIIVLGVITFAVLLGFWPT